MVQQQMQVEVLRDYIHKHLHSNEQQHNVMGFYVDTAGVQVQ